jgi:hypothetical protein
MLATNSANPVPWMAHRLRSASSEGPASLNAEAGRMTLDVFLFRPGELDSYVADAGHLHVRHIQEPEHHLGDIATTTRLATRKRRLQNGKT